jgi:hypothetical protein
MLALLVLGEMKEELDDGDVIVPRNPTGLCPGGGIGWGQA